MSEENVEWRWVPCPVCGNSTKTKVYPDTILTYYRLRRRENAQQEKDRFHHVFSYDDLDTNEILGEDMVPDLDSPSVEDLVLGKLLREWLHRCLDLLPHQERDLIEAIYFCGMSDKEYAQTLGITRRAVTKRRHKALNLLKKLLKF